MKDPKQRSHAVVTDFRQAVMASSDNVQADPVRVWMATCVECGLSLYDLD